MINNQCLKNKKCFYKINLYNINKFYQIITINFIAISKKVCNIIIEIFS